jgi:hypothetical protein
MVAIAETTAIWAADLTILFLGQLGRNLLLGRGGGWFAPEEQIFLGPPFCFAPYCLAALTASVRAGTTSNRSPTMP